MWSVPTVERPDARPPPPPAMDRVGSGTAPPATRSTVYQNCSAYFSANHELLQECVSCSGSWCDKCMTVDTDDDGERLCADCKPSSEGQSSSSEPMKGCCWLCKSRERSEGECRRCWHWWCWDCRIGRAE